MNLRQRSVFYICLNLMCRKISHKYFYGNSSDLVILPLCKAACSVPIGSSLSTSLCCHCLCLIIRCTGGAVTRYVLYSHCSDNLLFLQIQGPSRCCLIFINYPTRFSPFVIFQWPPLLFFTFSYFIQLFLFLSSLVPCLLEAANSAANSLTLSIHSRSSSLVFLLLFV